MKSTSPAKMYNPKALTTTTADFCETRQNAERKLTFERSLDNSGKLEVTIKSEDQAMFQPPSGWTLTADDIVETRCSSQPQRMRFPCDPGTTRRLEWVINGKEKLSWRRRLLRWMTGK